jgi:hypothetical protein
VLPHSVERNIVSNDLAVDLLFADSPSNQLRVLRAKIQDENSLID